MTLLWVDATAGVAGDMLLGALLDAGADLGTVQAAVRAVVGNAVAIEWHDVVRAGLRAAKAEVRLLEADPPQRRWPDVQTLITDAELDVAVRSAALAVFGRLADAEGRVHGIPPDEVHFHEVGALDSIADVVGVCAALGSLGVESITSSELALGSGTVRSAHGTIPVPVPAVVELARGWPVLAGGSGELATPTGVALITALATASGPLPPLLIERSGLGAGTKDTLDRANVTRVILGTPAPSSPPKLSTVEGLEVGANPELSTVAKRELAVVLEANVDDLDPRLWPEVLARLFEAGASDAWLTPIVMKKGRPAYTLSVLAPSAAAARLREMILTETTTFGVRETVVTKHPIARTWVDVRLGDRRVRVKIGHRDGVITQAMPEFADVAALAAERGVPARLVLTEAHAAAAAVGLVVGSPAPVDSPESR